MAQISSPGKAPYILLGIIVIGFILRVWGIDFGLPHQFHQDEPIVVNHALAYGTGDLNPRFFAIPPLTSYLLFLVYGMMFLLGSIFGFWQNTNDFAVFFFKDPTIFYLAGRFFIGVLPGTLAIFLTYRLASRFIARKAAIYASAMMAFSFLNVINSHYIYTDMILTVFILAAYERLFFMRKDPSVRNYCLAGVLIGLATGAKYNGAILAVPYLITHLFSGAGRGGRSIMSGKLWYGAGCAAASFVAVNPFSVLDFQGFIASFLHQSGAFWYTGWTHHITYSLFQGISMPLTLIGLAGMVFLAFSRDKWNIVFISFPAALYLVLVFKSQHFARYVLFVIPFISIGAGYLIFDRSGNLVRRHNIGRAVLFAAAILLIPTFVKSVKANIIFSSTDTRVTAADWIYENIPDGSKIACDSTIFRPAISQPYSQLIEKKDVLTLKGDLSGAVSKKLDHMIAVSDKEKKGYPLYFLYDDPEAQGQFLSTLPAMPYDIEVLLERGIEYVVINGQSTSEEKEKFIDLLRQRAPVIKDFSPYMEGVFSKTPDDLATTCMPIKDNDVFTRKFPGPSLRIYRIRGPE